MPAWNSAHRSSALSLLLYLSPSDFLHFSRCNTSQEGNYSIVSVIVTQVLALHPDISPQEFNLLSHPTVFILN